MKHHGSTPIHVGRSAITLRDVELYWTSTPDLKEVMTWMIKSKWIQWIKWNPKFLRDYKSHHLHLHWYLGTQQKDSEASDSHWACKDIRTNWPSKWSLDVADPVTKSDFKLRRHKSKVWSPKRNTTKPLGFVLCPSPQMCSKTSDLLKKHVRLGKNARKTWGKSSNWQKGKKISGWPNGSSGFKCDGTGHPTVPSEPWLWVPRQIPLFESGKHDHGPGCSSCPSLSMKALGFVSGLVTWNPTKNLAVLLSFGPLPCHTCLQQLVDSDFECKNRFYIKKPIELVFACFSRYFHPDPSTPSQCPNLTSFSWPVTGFWCPRLKAKAFPVLPPLSGKRGLVEVGTVSVHTHTFKRFKSAGGPQPQSLIAKVMLLRTTKIQNHSQLERVVIAIYDS